MNGAIFTLFFILLILAYARKMYVKARRRTVIWASQNGFELEKFRPAVGMSSSNFGRYHFVVIDKQGVRKKGVLRYVNDPLYIKDPEIGRLEDAAK